MFSPLLPMDFESDFRMYRSALFFPLFSFSFLRFKYPLKIKTVFPYQPRSMAWLTMRRQFHPLLFFPFLYPPSPPDAASKAFISFGSAVFPSPLPQKSGKERKKRKDQKPRCHHHHRHECQKSMKTPDFPISFLPFYLRYISCHVPFFAAS